MLVTDRTGQGAETRHWSDPDHVVAPPIFRSAANAKKIDFKPTRPQTFSRCFQQFPMFSSTSKFRFLKYYFHKIFQETSRIGRALCWKVIKFINVITDCLSSRYCVIQSKNNFSFPWEEILQIFGSVCRSPCCWYRGSSMKSEISGWKTFDSIYCWVLHINGRQWAGLTYHKASLEDFLLHFQYDHLNLWPAVC